MPMGAGFHAAERVQRRSFTWEGNAHWHRLLATIWITRHWSARGMVAAALESTYFGCDVVGGQHAARAFFGKPLDSLDLPQNILLWSMGRRSFGTRHGPPEYLHQEFERLEVRLRETWPEYGSKPIPFPSMAIEHCPAPEREHAEAPSVSVDDSAEVVARPRLF
ncbi:MAG: transglycosylase domain-containing protein [Fibrobacteria bacterium]|nr:transglycosylase domain-containing protein [Fibrobacteria bacterium]